MTQHRTTPHLTTPRPTTQHRTTRQGSRGTTPRPPGARVSRAGSPPVRTNEVGGRPVRRPWIARLVTLLTLAGLVGVMGALAAAPASANTPRGHAYYLSLGDSLAFGYQPNLVARGDTNPAHYRSYAEDYAAITPRLSLVNYGCPGETTGTFLTGRCPWTAPLHDSYGAATSQLAAATAFLQAHGSEVSLVTLDIGSNDLLALVSRCEAGPADQVQACLVSGLPAVLGTMAVNITTILQTVHQLAPNARVVLFNLYNPLALQMPTSDQLLALVNQQLAQVATANGARVADAFSAINIKAGSTAEKVSLCLLTWECTSYQNIHPNTLGYVALTAALTRSAR